MKTVSKKATTLAARSLLASLVLFSSLAQATPRSCADLFKTSPALQIAIASQSAKRIAVDQSEALKIATTPETKAMINSLLTFAAKYDLDERIVEVGPPQRRLKRLVVGLDIRRQDVVAAYLKEFNMENEVSGGPVRTLSLEFQKEVAGEYVLGALRTGSVQGSNEGIWRYGKNKIDHNNDWFEKWRGKSPTRIIGLANLIPITLKEAANVEHYLANPSERGPCKSDNCIAWAPGIELGKTFPNATQEERIPLFNALGVSRSIAHFEIGRRLAHAANHRHVAIVAYYADDIGKKTFRETDEFLPPQPQQPMEDIIRGIERSQDTPLAKAMNIIPDGGKVFFPIAAGASPEGMSALIDRSEKLVKGVDVHVLVNGISESTFKRGVSTKDNKFRVRALFLGGNLRALAKEGSVEVIPGYLSDFARHAANPNMPDFHYDAMVVRVAPADENGNYSLGPNNDMILSLIDALPNMKVIAEVNPNVPRTIGANFLTEKQITAKFPSTSALAGPPLLNPQHREVLIGDFLAQLIPDGATVQLGIGGTFTGLPAAMAKLGRKHIKFYTEMMGDPMMQMMESGVADSAETGFGYGSSVFYKWLDQNPRVRIIRTSVSNDPSLVGNIPNFHAVNTALQVTLRGDVNATHGADGFRMSSPGGQVEFMSAGMRAPGGKAIIAIRSTVKDDKISAITMDTYNGAVTTPHEMVTAVVTEFGIAQLAGKSEAQRALAMIRVAHPHFRKSLAEEAVAKHMITQTQASEFN